MITGSEAVPDEEPIPLFAGLAGIVDVWNLVEVSRTVPRPWPAGLRCGGWLLAPLTGLLPVFPVGGVLAPGDGEP